MNRISRRVYRLVLVAVEASEKQSKWVMKQLGDHRRPQRRCPAVHNGTLDALRIAASQLWKLLAPVSSHYRWPSLPVTENQEGSAGLRCIVVGSGIDYQYRL